MSSDETTVNVMGYDIEKLVENAVKDVIGKSNPRENRKLEKMTLSLARQIVERVKIKAKETGVNAVVAIADAGANVITVDCMDDAFIASYDIAVNKAFTSVALKMSTYDLGKSAQPGGTLYGIQNTNNGRIVIFGGGEPLEVDGKVIGGLGVSGGTAEQDTFLGSYGRQVFEELCKKQ